MQLIKFDNDWQGMRIGAYTGVVETDETGTYYELRPDIFVPEEHRKANGIFLASEIEEVLTKANEFFASRVSIAQRDIDLLLADLDNVAKMATSIHDGTMRKELQALIAANEAALEKDQEAVQESFEMELGDGVAF